MAFAYRTRQQLATAAAVTAAGLATPASISAVIVTLFAKMEARAGALFCIFAFVVVSAKTGGGMFIQKLMPSAVRYSQYPRVHVHYRLERH